MKLDYKILWIEDDKSWLESVEDTIKTFIANKSFYPIIEAPDVIDEDFFISEDLKDVDLVLMDYTLNSLSQLSGDEIIERLRSSGVFTNVVFYSSDTEKLKKEIESKSLGGVYIFDREELDRGNQENLHSLIDFYLERDMDINAMRGLAMSEVANLDLLMWEIISTNISREDIIDKLKEKRKDGYNQVNNKSIDQIWECIDNSDTSIIDSNSRYELIKGRIFKDIYKCNRVESDFSQLNERFEPYNEKILKMRNRFAHRVNEKLVDEDIVSCRKLLLEYRKLFAELRDKLCNQQ